MTQVRMRRFISRALFDARSCQVALVAAAPDHTLVLLQASCPSLPYAESLDTVSDGSRNQPGGINTSSISEGSEDGEDTDSDFEGRDDDVGESSRDGNNTAIAWFKSDLSEPPTLKQHCEMVLAREVDLRNAPTILAYADALDAPALVEYCAEFVSTNLDGILVLGRPSDQDCLLETSGALVRHDSLELRHNCRKYSTLCSQSLMELTTDSPKCRTGMSLHFGGWKAEAINGDVLCRV